MRGCHRRTQRAGRLRDSFLALLRDRSGVAAVDFALVAIPFLALIFALLQVILVFLAQAILETAADLSSRSVLTGNAQTAAMTQTQFQTSVCNNIPALLRCGGVMIDVETAGNFSTANIAQPTLTYDAQGHVTNSWQYNLGTQGQIVVMRIMYQWPVFNFVLNLTTQSNGTRMLMATRVFRNENY